MPKTIFLVVAVLILSFVTSLYAGMEPFYQGAKGMSQAETAALYEQPPAIDVYKEGSKKGLLCYDQELYGLPMQVCYYFQDDKTYEIIVDFSVWESSPGQVKSLKKQVEKDLKSQMPNYRTDHMTPKEYQGKTYYDYTWVNDAVIVTLHMELSKYNDLKGHIKFLERN